MDAPPVYDISDATDEDDGAEMSETSSELRKERLERKTEPTPWREAICLSNDAISDSMSARRAPVAR